MFRMALLAVAFGLGLCMSASAADKEYKECTKLEVKDLNTKTIHFTDNSEKLVKATTSDAAKIKVDGKELTLKEFSALPKLTTDYTATIKVNEDGEITLIEARKK